MDRGTNIFETVIKRSPSCYYVNSLEYSQYSYKGRKKQVAKMTDMASMYLDHLTGLQ